MWRRPLLIALLVVVGAVLVALLAGRETTRFQDDFDHAQATQAGWNVVGGDLAVQETGGRSALRLAAHEDGRYLVALADRGRHYAVDNLIVSLDLRAESGLSGIAFGLQNTGRLIGYRLEADPEAHTLRLYERQADGSDVAIHTYRDERINPGTWFRLTLTSTAEHFLVLVAFGKEQPREIIRNAQDHEHPGRQAFEQGRVGLYALEGTAWFDHLSVKGAAPPQATHPRKAAEYPPAHNCQEETP